MLVIPLETIRSVHEREWGQLIAQTAQGDQNALATLYDRTSPHVPRASLKERLMARVEGHTDVRLNSLKGLIFVKASEGVWQEMASGVSTKVLFFDQNSRRATALVRMAPGSTYAPHRHAEAEEFYVLEGGCFCGGRELKAGDYHRAEANTEHDDTSSNEGCLLLVISSPHNVMLVVPTFRHGIVFFAPHPRLDSIVKRVHRMNPIDSCVS